MVRDTLLVQFRTAGPAADDRLVREYVLDAVDRLPERPECTDVGFVPAGQKPFDGGLVLVTLVGDVEAIVEHERERWDALVEAGLAESWRTESTDRAAHYGERGAALRTRLEALAARMSRLAYAEFDASPPPTDVAPGERKRREAPTGVGWWTLLHVLSFQQGYYYTEEIDAYLTGIRDAAHKLAEYEGSEAAETTLGEAIETLETTRDRLA